MAYKELKELVIKKLKSNPDYLKEQMDILDDKVALFKTIDIVPYQYRDDERVLKMLIKIEKELENK